MKDFFTYLTYIFIGSLIGGIGGCAIGLGEVNYVKKSGRDTATPMLIIGFASFGVIGGIVAASNEIEREKKRKQEEEKQIARIERQKQRLHETGLDNIVTNKFKDGRRWVYESVWVHNLTGEKNTLRTFYSPKFDAAISELNTNTFVTYEKSTGAEKYISTCHNNSLNRLMMTYIHTD